MGKSSGRNGSDGILGRILRTGVRTGVSIAAAILLNAAADASAAAECPPAPAALGKYSTSAAGRMLPAVPYVAEDGSEHPLDSLHGQGLLVNFWATWCAPCVEELPALDRLAGGAAAHGMRVLTLSADREGAAVVRKFFEVNKITHLPVAMDRTGRLARALDVDGLPTTVLFDRDGHEAGRVVGVAQWDAPATLDFLVACLAPAG